MDCECLATCPFFNDQMADKPATSELLKNQFCKGNFEACARYIIFKSAGREHIPANLFPTQRDHVDQILKDLQIQ
ncbi:hypothetical protein JW835_14225 [bacterium]|nr:hypothetical protein [bacterium]